MNFNNLDDRALQERLRIEQQVEAETSAFADARSNTPSWSRIYQGDLLYTQQLILTLSSMVHGEAVAIDWESKQP